MRGPPFDGLRAGRAGGALCHLDVNLQPRAELVEARLQSATRPQARGGSADSTAGRSEDGLLAQDLALLRHLEGGVRGIDAPRHRGEVVAHLRRQLGGGIAIGVVGLGESEIGGPHLLTACPRSDTKHVVRIEPARVGQPSPEARRLGYANELDGGQLRLGEEAARRRKARTRRRRRGRSVRRQRTYPPPGTACPSPRRHLPALPRSASSSSRARCRPCCARTCASPALLCRFGTCPRPHRTEKQDAC
jgi:hypothetical protein